MSLGVGANAYPMGQWLDVTLEMHTEQLLQLATEGGAGYIETFCTYTYLEVNNMHYLKTSLDSFPYTLPLPCSSFLTFV